ncbi:hypothetical protein L3X38_039610 [Prunus dulcis]|uniref:Receptor ligand binding region domain-containing protein n=1 Tax=Prunus dulcis TaxID=3755 RepID=A0AAD4V8Z6_PRUDU|nr:hypothetical protein L3X38_039610 [Prunus dulcis]
MVSYRWSLRVVTSALTSPNSSSSPVDFRPWACPGSWDPQLARARGTRSLPGLLWLRWRDTWAARGLLPGPNSLRWSWSYRVMLKEVEGADHHEQSLVAYAIYGAIFTFDSVIGKIAKFAIALAVEDVNSDPEMLNGTKLTLKMQNTKSSDFLGIIEALQFMENDTVAIIGPQFSATAHVISHIVDELKVPLLSFAATDPTLSPTQFPFLVRTTRSDLFQMTAVADLVDYYEWRDVIAIYVNDDFGRNAIAALGDKLAEKRCKISYKVPLNPRATKDEITNALISVSSMESRILILHIYTSWGLQVLTEARNLMMMASGYVWIATD